MRKFLIALILLVTGSVALAQQLDQSPEKTPKMKPLSITITKSLYLPPEMYGHWSVTGTLVSTNAQNFFNPVVHDIWVLERSGEQVTLTNPVSGASANIEVDKVDGDTATFHHMVVHKNKIMMEMPTITVDGNRMSGISINKFQQIKNGRVVRSLYSQYKLEATRIGEDRKKFKEEAEVDPDLEFEIEEVLPERPSQKPEFQ